MKDKQEIIDIIEKLKEKLSGIRLLFECLSTASINGMDSQSVSFSIRCFLVLLTDMENDIIIIKEYLLQKQTVL